MSDHVDTVVLATTTFSQEEFGGGHQPAAAQATSSQGAGSNPNGAAATAAPSSQDVQDALQRINDHLASVGRVIDLQVDPETHLTVATVRDTSTGDVLQQYPAEDSLHLAQMLAGWSHGGNILLDLIA